MKQVLHLILTATILAGCTRETTSTIPELDGRVLTVDQYLAQPDVRKKVSLACHNDPGRLGLTPNCVNVRRADHIASMGTPESIRIDLSP
jgi:hypothetical protein